MSDVSKINQGKGGPESSGPKRKKKGDTEAFKEMMKVGKVRETDPEEKRKRKKQAEAEEDFKADLSASPPKQGLESKEKEPTIFEPKQGTQADFSEQPSKAQPSQSSPPPSQPQEQQPNQSPSTSSPQSQEQQPSSTPTTNKTKQDPDSSTSPTPPSKQPPPTSAPKLTEAEKKAVEETKAEQSSPILPPIPEKDELKTDSKKKKEPDEPLPPPPSSPLPEGAWESTKHTKEDKSQEKTPPQEKTPLGPEGTLPQTLQAATAPTPSQAPPPLQAPFSNLPPQVAQLFEKMAGVMTVMHESGVTQTTIHLDNPQFAHSVFYGAQVMLTEFSTAPKQFNIELLGSQQAVALFEGNAEELVAAFQAGNYNFKVNRIDAGYLPPSAAVRKKEARRVKRKKSGEK